MVRARGNRRVGDNGVGIAAVLDGAGIERQRVRRDADAVAVHIGCDHGVAELQVGRAGAAVVGGVAGVAADGEADARRAARRVNVHAVAERRRDLDVVAGDVLVVGARAVQGERRTGVADGALASAPFGGGLIEDIARNTKIFAGVTCDGPGVGLVFTSEGCVSTIRYASPAILRCRCREAVLHSEVPEVLAAPGGSRHAEAVRVGPGPGQRDGAHLRLGIHGNEAGQRGKREDSRQEKGVPGAGAAGSASRE